MKGAFFVIKYPADIIPLPAVTKLVNRKIQFPWSLFSLR